MPFLLVKIDIQKHVYCRPLLFAQILSCKLEMHSECALRMHVREKKIKTISEIKRECYYLNDVKNLATI